MVAGLWSERTYSSSNAHHCNARDVLSLLYACLDRAFNPPKPTNFLVLGPIAQARTQITRYKDLAEYLLLLPVTASFTVKSDKPASILDDPTSDYHPTPMGD